MVSVLQGSSMPKFIFLKDIISPFTGKKYRKGDIIDVSPDKIQPFIEQGVLGEYNKYEWCFNVCMLIEGQAKFCKRVTPCPRFGNNQSTTPP